MNMSAKDLARRLAENPELGIYHDATAPGKTAVTVEQFDTQPTAAPAQDIYQKIVLMGERPQSWNRLKRFNRWQWQQEVNRVKNLVLAALGGRADTLPVKVDIRVAVYFDKRPYDSSNIPLKLYEDGLTAAGLLVDDSPKYVGWVSKKSFIDRENPRVEIEIFTAVES